MNPLLWLAVSFALGIVIAHFSSFDWRIAALATSVFAIAAIIVKQTAAGPLLLVSFIALGTFSALVQKNSVAENRLRRMYDEGRIGSGEVVEVEGVLLGKPEPVFNGFVLDLDTRKLLRDGVEQSISGRLRLYASAETDEIKADYSSLGLQYGSRIRVACDPARGDSYLNPGVLPRKNALDLQGIDATATVKSPLLIEKLGEESVFIPVAGIYDLRALLIEQFRDKFSISTSGILNASLLGDKYFLDKQTADIFREGGTFHVLVISGLHITFIGGLTFLFVGFFTKRKVWRFVFTISFLWAYTLAVGADVPVVRASMMFTVLLFSQVIYRKSSLLNALGFCALVLLSWRPSELFDPSFQLTFVSVAAIVGVAFPLIEKLRSAGSWQPTAETPFPPNVPNWLRSCCETLYWREGVWKIESGRQIWSASLFKSPYLKWPKSFDPRKLVVFIFEGILVSIIAQAWLLPLLIVYFHRVSVASVLLNLWVGIFIALESFSAIAAVVLSSVSGLFGLPLIKLTELLNSALLSVPGIFVHMNWASFRLPAYTGPMKAIYLVYFLPLLVLAYSAYKWEPFAIDRQADKSTLDNLSVYAASALGFALLAVIVFHPLSAPFADGKLHVDLLDVGQGDSALVTFPGGETLLIDGGGKIKYRENDTDEQFQPDTRNIGEAVVSEFLWAKGYSRIDHILATHADADHIQGLVDVAKNFSIGSAFFGRMPESDPDFAELADVLRRRGVVAETIARGDVLKFGDVSVEVLYPRPIADPNAVSDNNHSVVLRIIFGARSILLTGDIERQAEMELISSGGTLVADLIKVPHHGSRTSSTQDFINAVGAKYAVISVGRSSAFGHPHKDVVDRWKAEGANVMTTGERGTISVSTDGRDFVITTFLP